MKALVLRKFKSIQHRKPSKDGLKTSVKQYDAYLLFAPNCEPNLINMSLAKYLLDNNFAELKGES